MSRSRNRSASEVFDFAHSQGIAVLNAAPYASGVLAKGSAKMPLITYQLADDDALKPVRAIEAICARYDVAPGAVALQLSMNDKRITSAIVGVSKPERINETLEWASADIPQAMWDEINELAYSTDDPEANREYKPG